VPHVAEYVADIRKVNGGRVPTARHWLGFTAVMTLGLIAAQEKTTDGRKLARALGGFALPPEIKLQPNNVYYRAGDHQLMLSCFVGRASERGATDPDDLFAVDQVMPGEQIAQPVAETGCTLHWPA
jgi:branched-chain amino acid transport system substrate-binding protein